MLSRLILEERIPSAQNAVVTPRHSTSWCELREHTRLLVGALALIQMRRVGLRFEPIAGSYAALAALNRLSCDAFLFDAHLPREEALRLAQKLKLGAFLSLASGGTASNLHVHELPGEDGWSGSSTVTVLTSGTTGEPKAVRHSWESLSRPVRKGPRTAAPKWLLAYRPHLYAGLQVALQCFADTGSLIVPDVDMDLRSAAQFMCATGVQFASATPSYWRQLLMFSDAAVLRRVPLVQITIGGEIVDQVLLDNIRRCFPKVRLVHIYATTELGRCFSVTDGMAGFPASYLDVVLHDGVELRVEKGELLVRSPNSMRMYDPHSSSQGAFAEYFATGDLVELKGDRVYFVGRRSDMINVAGSKVHPIEVERTIRAVPGVSDVRVFGTSSSIAGELVACEIVPAPGQDREALKGAVIRRCRSQLASQQQPRSIRLVDRISLSSGGKTVRRIVP